eukprot:TRINITY_DN704_c0_g2_i1.p1 TRINITY_DN704_c0_g2~~TRINITY_DN704_c0_g2_i1.p1  ORF type:complete len:261 (+),score=1.15 TRINITY_DN704_c0_g2_i1:730-1512(+)
MFHLVDRSPWPFFMSSSLFIAASGMLWYMNRVQFGGYFLLVGIFAILFCMYAWWGDVIRESTFQGNHTSIVVKGLQLGFKLFILSEVMFFFGFFWAFFSAALSPTIWLSYCWMPEDFFSMDAFGTPLLNTIILVVSGASITWAHRSFKYFRDNDAWWGFVWTIFFGTFFLTMQVLEYINAPFTFSDSVVGSTFYCLTGLHGLHVSVGLLFIIICFIRFVRYHFTAKRHLGFIFAIWYWHFVDVVWLFLFIFVYVWGSGSY